jgi:hypothetical protein
MPVTWEYRSALLIVSVIGVIENQEIERAFDEALLDARSGATRRLLWDARQSVTPVSSDDVAWRIDLVSSLAERGHFSRAALLGRGEHRGLLTIWLTELPKLAHAIPLRAFTNESEALAWLAS